VAKGNEEDVNKAVEAADNVYLDFRHSTVEYRTSSSLPLATEPMTSSVAGLITSIVSPLALSTHSPLIKQLKLQIMYI
jgi:hypothetical protein